MHQCRHNISLPSPPSSSNPPTIISHIRFRIHFIFRVKHCQPHTRHITLLHHHTRFKDPRLPLHKQLTILFTSIKPHLIRKARHLYSFPFIHVIPIPQKHNPSNVLANRTTVLPPYSTPLPLWRALNPSFTNQLVMHRWLIIPERSDSPLNILLTR